jgi:hypothetical protein
VSIKGCSLHLINQEKIMHINQQMASGSPDQTAQGEKWIGDNHAELAYLFRFIQCYHPGLRIVNRSTWPIYVMEDRETQIGIAFCDLQPLKLERNHHSEVINDVLYPAPGTVTELWLVYVASNIGQHQCFLGNKLKNIS